MKRTIALSTALTLSAGLLLCAGPVQAKESDDLTYFTFSAPVALPGIALPAGTYMFKHPDSGLDQQVVQVFSKDGRTIYGTFLTIPEQRTTPGDEPTVTMGEARRGSPEVITAWFPRGTTTGEEFIYSGEHAGESAGPAR
jgi:hypothetical protein